MKRMMASTARGGSATSMVSTRPGADDEGCASWNISLKTGDVRERRSLWTLKSRLSLPWVAHRITSPSGQLSVSSELTLIVQVGEWLVENSAETREIAEKSFPGLIALKRAVILGYYEK